KPVHHRQHDDEGGHAERDAQHGYARDEGNEAVAPCGAAGAGVAPSQNEFVRCLHAMESSGGIVASLTIAPCPRPSPPLSPPRTCWFRLPAPATPLHGRSCRRFTCLSSAHC